MFTSWRWMALLGLVALLGGCNKAKPGATVAGGSSAVEAGGHPARGEADAFLRALTGGDTKAALEKTSAAFRKEVSGPLTFEEEKKVGYSNTDTEKFLQEAAAGSDKAEIRSAREAPDGKEVVFRGSLGGREAKLFSLRMKNEGGGWRVTRFFAGRVMGSGAPTEAGEPELAWAREAALDFLEALVGSNDEHLLTMSGMTEEFKARLPAPSVADAGLKYAKKDVRDWLNALRQGVRGFAINTQAKHAKVAQFTGDLVGPGKSPPFTLLLVRQGEAWKVDDFTAK